MVPKELVAIKLARVLKDYARAVARETVKEIPADALFDHDLITVSKLKGMVHSIETMSDAILKSPPGGKRMAVKKLFTEMCSDLVSIAVSLGKLEEASRLRGVAKKTKVMRRKKKK